MVAIYPHVGDRERDAALARIAARHERIEDSRWSEAGAEGDDPARDVLDYLRRRHHELPRAVSSEDSFDALVLAAWVHWDERRRERELLRRARSYGHSLGELGAFLGLATRQGTYEYLDRLEALLTAHADDQARQTRAATQHTAAQQRADGHPRDPNTLAGVRALSTLPQDADDLYRRTRGRRAADTGAGPETVRASRRRARALPTRERWLAEHHDELHTVVGALLIQCARLGIETRDQDSEDLELADTLAVLARHHHSADPHTDVDKGVSATTSHAHRQDTAVGRYSPATLGALGLTLGELRTHPAVTALARNHGAHQAIAAADRLRARYSALS